MSIEQCHSCHGDITGAFYHSCTTPERGPTTFLTKHGIQRMKEIRLSDKRNKSSEFRQKSLGEI